MTAPERIRITSYGVDDVSGKANGQPLAIHAGTEYIRADLAAVHPAQVRVKLLVWDAWDGGMTTAATPFGKYILSDDLRMSFPTGRCQRHESELSAKTAAQTDYQARILAAIEPQPDPSDEVIKGLVEALGECRQAITDYMNQYPHMAKGYLVDAEQHARAALAAAKAVQK